MSRGREGGKKRRVKRESVDEDIEER
jgi:hypothetical protein